MKTTPFHPRLVELNDTGLWSHWSGYLSAVRYDFSSKFEYFGIRNAAAFFDASPLYKFWIRGADAERYLAGVMARDVRTVRPGRAQYTVWCDDEGYVLEDGVLFRHAADEFMLTAAEPNLSFLQSQAIGKRVEIVDVSEDYATLAVQGPRSRAILEPLAPEIAELSYFGFTPAKVAGHPVTISRTGFTGDLGFEVMVGADDALPVLDAILEAGQPHGLRPFGEEALNMARIEAGLPLIGTEFTSARYAYNAAERFTPTELGLGWLLRGIDDDTRPFVGRDAIRRELADKTSRWTTRGIVVDWRAYRDLYEAHGLIPEMDEIPVGWETMLYDDAGERVGYATSLMYSPMMQRYIGIARIKPELAAVGGTVQVEQTVDHEYYTVPAEITTLPFFNPERKLS
ncbi:MAG: aminomethyltransferase family protein [Nocardioides sp.]|uniref:aminomethyltransferase family protein n=1 Tax=Nocardioides sp. TaxID=35761 RepID=UPI0039E215FD